MAETGRRLVASTSFQTHSLPLLHLLAHHSDVSYCFLDTGFHFPETLAFRDEVAALLGIEVRTIRSEVPLSAQIDRTGMLLFAANPDDCCHLNKTAPMHAILRPGDIWVSGVRRAQNANRAGFDRVMQGPSGTTRYHPLLDWTDEMIRQYSSFHGLPAHPLDAAGYSSIGCAPCTRRSEGKGDHERDTRWFGLEKTECGLHLDLAP